MDNLDDLCFVNEYEAVAEHCGNRYLLGHQDILANLPNDISYGCRKLIDLDREAFFTCVHTYAYAKSMEGVYPED